MRRSFISAILCRDCRIALVASRRRRQCAAADGRVQVGVLECRGGASVGFIVGSVTNLGCVLRVEGLPEDRYVATIRKVGLDLGITQETALAWGVYRAGGAARARRSRGQLCRRAGQRIGRRRRRRQCAGRRLQQFDRAAAAQRAGPGRPQRRRRAWKAWNSGRAGNLCFTLTISHLRVGNARRLGVDHARGRDGVRLMPEDARVHRDDAPQRHFPACQTIGAGRAFVLPTQSRAELQHEGGGEWDKTSEVPAVHGASRWWALSKAVKPHFSKRYWRARAPSRAPAASTPEPPSAMPAPRPAITR